MILLQPPLVEVIVVPEDAAEAGEFGAVVAEVAEVDHQAVVVGVAVAMAAEMVVALAAHHHHHRAPSSHISMAPQARH